MLGVAGILGQEVIRPEQVGAMPCCIEAVKHHVLPQPYTASPCCKEVPVSIPYAWHRLMLLQSVILSLFTLPYPPPPYQSQWWYTAGMPENLPHLDGQPTNLGGILAWEFLLMHFVEVRRWQDIRKKDSVNEVRACVPRGGGGAGTQRLDVACE